MLFFGSLLTLPSAGLLIAMVTGQRNVAERDKVPHPRQPVAPAFALGRAIGFLIGSAILFGPLLVTYIALSR